MLVPKTNADYLKYMFDGVTSLPELAERLREAAAFYEDLAKTKDARLVEPVDSGHVLYMVPGEMEEVDDEEMEELLEEDETKER